MNDIYNNTGFDEYLSSGRAISAAMSGDTLLMQRVESAVGEVVSALESGLPVLVAGNGGSASDALHISGELVGKFYRNRRGLDVICLNTNVTVLTAWSNDESFDTVFSRQVEAHGKPGAVFWGLSTSGNSINLVRAFEVARNLGLRTIAMTGMNGGAVAPLADVLINIPSADTPRVQEAHTLAYHYICREVERSFADFRSVDGNS